MCKAPVKSSPSTKQHPTFYRPGGLAITKPTALKGKQMALIIIINVLIMNINYILDFFWFLGSTP